MSFFSVRLPDRDVSNRRPPAAMKLIIALLSVAGTSAFTPLRSPSSLRARAITRMSEEPVAEPVAETVTEEPAAPSSEGR